ncbi:unnamed protein product [Sphagnum balticum]
MAAYSQSISSSGGGGGGSVTQGTSPWVDNITQIGGANIALGQTTKSASLPVALASDQGNLPVSLTAASTYSAQGGTSNALLTTTPVAIKSSAGTLYGVSMFNTGSATTYVQFFDVASGSVTLGTTVPKYVIPIYAGGAWEEKFAAGMSFANAITVAATTTPTGNTAPATGINANVTYA